MIPFKLNEVHIDGSLGDDTASSTRCDARVVFFCEGFNYFYEHFETFKINFDDNFY